MKQVKRFTIFSIILLILLSLTIGAIYYIKRTSVADLSPLNINKVVSKTEQNMQILGYVKRNIPKSTSNEGLNSRYPVYGTSLSNITDEEKDNIIKESGLLIASSSTYDSMDKDGNLYLANEKTGKKLYKHTASEGMYYYNVADSEKAVKEKITLKAKEQRNYITGLYAPAGEVIKVEISNSDLEKIGGLTVVLGQTSHRNVQNNIWKARNDFSRMTIIGNIMEITKPISYVGTFLGGPIYIYPKNQNVEFSVTISGGVQYPYYIHGYTTREEFNSCAKSSAPYFDFEIWDTGVRHSGSKKYANFDYDNLVKVGNLWEKICQTSRQVPPISNSKLGVNFVYDCFVAAGEACAFTGNNTWVNAPCGWLSGSLDYEGMTTNGFWGQIHEFNHHYQSYGIAPILEVTNNATSLLSYVSYTNISSKRSEDNNTLGNGWNRYTDPTRSLKETINNGPIGQTSLNIYADLIHSFGVENFVKMTKVNAGKSTKDTWFESVSKISKYDMTYYFETLLGHTISDDMKTLYKNEDNVFVPAFLLYQTGRNYFIDDKEYFTDTVRPYEIESKKEVILDFEKNLVIPPNFDFTIKNITEPLYGTLVKLEDKKYKYIPSNNLESGEFKVTISLTHETIKTKDITFIINLKQKDAKPTLTKYIYSSNVYSSTDKALENNFEGYADKTIINNYSTFLNGISKNQIGVTEGKIYIPKTSTYSICLRAGRGNHALYTSTNGIDFEKAIEFSGDKNTFNFDESHTVSLNLKQGDYLYYKQVTISNGHPDAYTELGWSYDNSNMVTIPSKYLYNIDCYYTPYSFELESRYPRVYTTLNTPLILSDITKQKVISINQDPWDDTTKIENITDGDLNTFYHSKQNSFVSNSNPLELVLDLGESKLYNQIKITGRKTGQLNIPTTFDLYGGEDLNSLILIKHFEDLTYSANIVYANFDAQKLRYCKLVITDTKSNLTGNYNKYVCISQIDFNYIFNGKELSCDELNYFGFKINKSTISTFGHLISGSGEIEYSYTGGDFILITKQQHKAKIEVDIDGNKQIISINQTNKKAISFMSQNLENTTHNIKIKVLSGTLDVDSIFIGN